MLVSKRVEFPHDCQTSVKTWIRTSDTRYKIICSWCRKTMGTWNYTPESKIFPEDENAKFSLEQKKDLK